MAIASTTNALLTVAFGGNATDFLQGAFFGAMSGGLSSLLGGVGGSFIKIGLNVSIDVFMSAVQALSDGNYSQKDYISTGIAGLFGGASGYFGSKYNGTIGYILGFFSSLIQNIIGAMP